MQRLHSQHCYMVRLGLCNIAIWSGQQECNIAETSCSHWPYSKDRKYICSIVNVQSLWANITVAMVFFDSQEINHQKIMMLFLFMFSCVFTLEVCRKPYFYTTDAYGTLIIVLIIKSAVFFLFSWHTFFFIYLFAEIQSPKRCIKKWIRLAFWCNIIDA